LSKNPKESVNQLNKKIRKLFTATEKYTYLNSAAVAPLPSISIEAVAAQLKDVGENGSVNFNDWVATKNRARSLAAQMLNVKAEQIAFMRNTSDALSTVANGLKWKKGDNIVSFAKEFPANFYAWRRIRDAFGVELRLCPERDGRIDLDEFINLIDENTKIVSISAVQFASGFRADLGRIGAATRAVDALENVEQAFQPNALAWESGTGAASLFYGLEQSLKILSDAGAENIKNYLEDLTDYLCELLAEKNYEIVSSRNAGEKSQIVCVKHRGGLEANEIAKRLERENVIVSPRGDRIRIAPHFFNNREDIERLSELLP